MTRPRRRGPGRTPLPEPARRDRSTGGPLRRLLRRLTGRNTPRPDRPEHRLPSGVRLGRVGETVVVAVSGEIDIVTLHRLRTGVQVGLDEASSGPVLVDLTQVPFMASAAVFTLVELACSARAEHRPLRILVDPARPAIRRTELADLEDVLALYDDANQALAAPARPSPGLVSGPISHG